MSAKTQYTAGTAPGALPLVGHGRQLLRRPLEFLSELPRYGDLVEIRLGPQPAYVPCHQDLLHQVLADDRTFDKGGLLYEKARDFLGNGLGACPHADHRAQRRLLQPAFRPERLEQYGTAVEDRLGPLQESWYDGVVIDAFSTWYRFTLGTAVRALFSTEIADETAERIERALDVMLGSIFARMLVPGPLQKVPTPGKTRYAAAIADLHKVIDELVTEYRATGKDHGDVLSIVLASGGSMGREPTPTELHDQMTNLLTASSETSAATLTWACGLLAQHPEAMRRIQEEVDRVLGDRPVTWADVPDLAYTRQVLNETMRLYPAGWLLTRVTTGTGTEMAGRRIPAGSTVVFSPYVVQRRADLFERPDAFDPDRWEPERAARMPRGAFSTFGGGARKCIGDTFALGETAMALASVVRRWNLAVAPGADLRPARLATILRPRRLGIRLSSR
ncbi:cytochrome P450 [Streptomyces sp. NPDC097619]|uniref:cytochrome P450 n=1 Tax=Streptomyces sp. NPDC097619 TaxID=3157228 RepID=UPI003318BDB0